MPSSKKYDEYDVLDTTSEDTFSVDLDEQGNPFIIPDLHNIGMDQDKIEWIDKVYDDIVFMYRNIIDYRNNCSDGPLLEKITFNRFLIFIAQNSFQKS